MHLLTCNQEPYTLSPLGSLLNVSHHKSDLNVICVVRNNNLKDKSNSRTIYINGVVNVQRYITNKKDV